MLPMISQLAGLFQPAQAAQPIARSPLFVAHCSLLITHCSLLVIHFLAPFTGFSQQATPDYKDVEYARIGGQSLTLDIYLPKNAAAPYPVVVWIHGGAWVAGSKKSVTGLGLLRKGYALVSINYRFSWQAIHPAQIQDCKGAIRWIRAKAGEYGWDPERIGVWGSSAGGHLAALLGTSGGVPELEGSVGGNVSHSSRVQAVCDWFGPSDMLTIGDYPASVDHRRGDSPEGRLLGGPPKKVPDRARAASPVSYASPDDPPFLIQHGTNDPIVPFRQSVELDSVLRAHHVVSLFKPIQGAGHGGGGFNVDTTFRQVADFFDRYLKRSSTAGWPARTEPSLQHMFVSPHPAVSRAIVNFTLKRPSPVRLRLADFLGRQLLLRPLGRLEAGSHAAELDVHSLPRGHYYVFVMTNREVKGKEMMVFR